MRLGPFLIACCGRFRNRWVISFRWWGAPLAVVEAVDRTEFLRMPMLANAGGASNSFTLWCIGSHQMSVARNRLLQPGSSDKLRASGQLLGY